MRLTAELIQASPQFTNPLKDRELDLRGNGISAIENLGATQDQFEVIDLSDNDIRILENFPLLKRLRTLILNNNKIFKLDPKLHEMLPHLRDLVLTNNQLREISDLLPILDFASSLQTLSLMDNPVALRHSDEQYRLYIIAHMPQLRMLDFRKIKLKERQEAAKLYANAIAERQQKLREEGAAASRSKRQKKQQQQVTTEKEPAAKTFVPGEIPAAVASTTAEKHLELTPAEKKKIKDAITRATTMEEVARLESFLKRGKLPKELRDPNSATNDTDNTMEIE